MAPGSRGLGDLRCHLALGVRRPPLHDGHGLGDYNGVDQRRPEIAIAIARLLIELITAAISAPPNAISLLDGHHADQEMAIVGIVVGIVGITLAFVASLTWGFIGVM